MRRFSRAAAPRALTVWGVPVEPHFRQQRGKFMNHGAMDLVVEVEEQPLWRRGGWEALPKATVQLGLGFLLGGELPCLLEPCLKVAPADTAGGDRPVVDEYVVRVTQNFDVVVDGIVQSQVRLRGRGEDQVFGRPLCARIDATSNAG